MSLGRASTASRLVFRDRRTDFQSVRPQDGLEIHPTNSRPGGGASAAVPEGWLILADACKFSKTLVRRCPPLLVATVASSSARATAGCLWACAVPACSPPPRHAGGGP